MSNVYTLDFSKAAPPHPKAQYRELNKHIQQTGVDRINMLLEELKRLSNHPHTYKTLATQLDYCINTIEEAREELIIVHQIDQLRDVLKKLDERDRVFAISLIGQFDKNGKLSVKQWPFVERLVLKGNTPKGERLEFPNIYAAFVKAKVHLKNPRIVIGDKSFAIKITMAGQDSVNVGQLYVRGLHDNVFHGRINSRGEFIEPAMIVSDTDRNKTVELLRNYNSAPIGTALKYAKATGECCFCLKELTDPRSVEAGYGPTCADNWGLPYDGKDPSEQDELLELF